MLHVIRREGLLDRAFLEACVTGWEDVLTLLAECTPEWGEAVTGVPAALDRRSGDGLRAGTVAALAGQGLQRQRAGAAVFRACSLLPIAMGNLGKPGAGFLYLNGTDSRMHQAYPSFPSRRGGSSSCPASNGSVSAGMPPSRGTARRPRSPADASCGPPTLQVSTRRGAIAPRTP